MFGVVGKVKIDYQINDNHYEEIIDPQTTSDFSLTGCNNVKFRIEEVTYVEDTVYGVVLSLVEPEYKEDEYIVGNNRADFSIDEYNIVGIISLMF